MNTVELFRSRVVRFAILSCLVATFVATTASAITVKAGGTASELAQLLTGPGVTITNAKITGDATAIGTFAAGSASGFDVDSGVILSSGKVDDAVGPNDSDGKSTGLGTSGDTGLDALVKPFVTHDAMILEFDVVTVGEHFSIQYVFASEEYKEYVNSQFNDVFAFFVDGTNIALVPATSEKVSINTINHLHNTNLYRDNPINSKNLDTQFDGITGGLFAETTVSAGTTHHIRLAIADASDSALDSAVFLATGGITGGEVAPAIIPEIRELVIENGQTLDDKLTIYNFTTDSEAVVNYTADGLPEGASIQFVPTTSDVPGTIAEIAKVTIGPDVLAGTYVVTIRASAEGGGEGKTTILVIVDCRAPFILGAAGNQPLSQSVGSGQTATLHVKASGSTPYRYQWYAGSRGQTLFPIAGATSADYKTSAITSATDYWVRITNPCGSVDSATATVRP